MATLQTPFVDVKLHVQCRVAAVSLGNISEAVKSLLDARLLKWDPELEGVMLLWRDLSFVKKRGVIIASTPGVFVHFSYKAVLFAPRIGHRFFFGYFSAAIVESSLKEKGFRFVGNMWMRDGDKDSGVPTTKICRGDVITFCVSGLSSAGGFLSLEGYPDASLTENVGVAMPLGKPVELDGTPKSPSGSASSEETTLAVSMSAEGAAPKSKRERKQEGKSAKKLRKEKEMAERERGKGEGEKKEKHRHKRKREDERREHGKKRKG